METSQAQLHTKYFRYLEFGVGVRVMFELRSAPCHLMSFSDHVKSIMQIKETLLRNGPRLKRYSLLQQLCSGWVDESQDSTLTLDLHFALCWVTPYPEDRFDKNQKPYHDVAHNNILHVCRTQNSSLSTQVFSVFSRQQKP